MALIITSRPNAGYHGKHRQTAAQRIAAGQRVGIVPISGDVLEKPTWHCHVCKTDNLKQLEGLERVNGKIDAFSECPKCHTPFIIWEAL